MKEIAKKIFCLLAASLMAGGTFLLLAILIQLFTISAFPTYYDMVFALAITLVYSTIIGIVIGLPILLIIQRIVSLRKAFKLFVLTGSIIGGGVELFVAYGRVIPMMGLVAGAAGGASLWWFLQVSERWSRKQ